MSFVAEIRARAGLSQAELAERAATSRTRLSAYENSRTAPELDTLERLADAADLELALAPRGTRRVNAQIDAIRSAAADGRTADGVRLIAELMAWARDGVVELEVLQHEPAGTGDRRWGAFMAGVAEILFAEQGRPVPGWASSPARILDHPWFVSSLRSLWPEILVTTPAALAARGVLISARSLESV
jgi:transcriptional regulator with XRE-family HTH domain